MSDPFFNYIRDNSKSISTSLYGPFSQPKRYERYPQLVLPFDESPAAPYADVVTSRKSSRSYASAPLELSVFGNVLYWSLAHHADAKSEHGFLFPSGGGTYPIETYVLVQNIAGLERGIYHYDPRKHAVTKMPVDALSDDVVKKIFFETVDIKGAPQCVVVMTMVKERIIQTYGARAYYLALVEAGHRGQLLYQGAAMNKLGCCACGRVDYDDLHSRLSLDGTNEHYVYSVLLGLP